MLSGLVSSAIFSTHLSRCLLLLKAWEMSRAMFVVAEVMSLLL